MVTSAKSIGSQPSALSKVMTTSANPVRLRCWLPAKITSSARRVRRDRLDCSPRTHRTASAMFDLPLPLGPMTALTPGSKTKRVGSAKVLNPCRRSSRSLLTAWRRTGLVPGSRDARRFVGALEGWIVAPGREELERRAGSLLLRSLPARPLPHREATTLEHCGHGESLLV